MAYAQGLKYRSHSYPAVRSRAAFVVINVSVILLIWRAPMCDWLKSEFVMAAILAAGEHTSDISAKI